MVREMLGNIKKGFGTIISPRSSSNSLAHLRFDDEDWEENSFDDDESNLSSNRIVSIDGNQEIFLFSVKTKLFTGPSKGQIVSRNLEISDHGIKVYDASSRVLIENYPFEMVRNFFYAEDNCFVVIQRMLNGEPDNVVWKTAKQADKVKAAIDLCIKRRLEAVSKAKQDSASSPPLSPSKISRSNSSMSEETPSVLLNNAERRANRENPINSITPQCNDLISFD